MGRPDLNFSAPPLENVAETRPCCKFNLEVIAERHNVSGPKWSASPQAGASRSAQPGRSLVTFLAVLESLAAK